MGNLIKIDFLMILKDKLFIIGLILCGVFALFQPALFGIISKTISTGYFGGINVFNSYYFFNSLFTFSSNLGLILPIFIMIIIGKDFSQGTLRNKVIAGYSRSKIYFSYYLTTLIFITVLLFCTSLLSFLFGAAFFGFQSVPIEHILKNLVLEILICVFITSLLIFFSTALKKTGLAIVLYVAVGMGLAVLGTVSSIAIPLISRNIESKATIETLNSLLYLNPGQIVSYLPIYDELYKTAIESGPEAVKQLNINYFLMVSSTSILCAAFTLFGWIIFRKSDLK